MTNFPTKIKENVAFFTVHFLYLALLVALFIPYMVAASYQHVQKNPHPQKTIWWHFMDVFLRGGAAAWGGGR